MIEVKRKFSLNRQTEQTCNVCGKKINPYRYVQTKGIKFCCENCFYIWEGKQK